MLLREKELKYIGKWGNNSKVGGIINNYNVEMLDTLPVQSPTRNKLAMRQPGMLSPSADNRKGHDRQSSLPAIRKQQVGRNRRLNKSLVPAK